MSLSGAHGFVQTKGPTPWLIRKLTGGPWNHTFVFITDTIILEAKLLRGVHLSHISKYYGKPVVVIKPNEVLDEAAHDAFVEKHIFSVYGLLQLIGFLWVLLFKREHNPITDGVVCSELNWMHATEVWSDYRIEKRMFKNTSNPNNLFSYAFSEWEHLFHTLSLSAEDLQVCEPVVDDRGDSDE